MSKGEAAVEPSMDEILTSIRKIIAEDEVDGESAVGHGTAGADDDILELTEEDEAPPQDAIDAEFAEEADVVAEGDAAPQPEPAAEIAMDDFLEPATEAQAAVVFDEAVEADPADTDEPQEPPVATPETAPAATPGAAPVVEATRDTLLDAVAAGAASDALHRLSAAVSPGDAVPGGNRSIETFLADMLRPELKGWLDQHLPALVERIVEREIKRLIRDAQPE